ncbi:hypothetical protein [Rhodococcus sp. HNM0569]|uniref:hypothetical protein n=1 Tax=Rhodococcus sp. HNM0569 TaxID=2716340 RepID=UPI001469EFC7|nr:hypothetical protein [Rhodococcus sp. HNM0569]NLU82027.1 hypothetical protein [Rhodococcus sp. HNM0569]
MIEQDDHAAVLADHYFDGSDLVEIPAKMFEARRLAELAYERGYVFAWGRRRGIHIDITTFFFRRLYPRRCR